MTNAPGRRWRARAAQVSGRKAMPVESHFLDMNETSYGGSHNRACAPSGDVFSAHCRTSRTPIEARAWGMW